MKDILSPCRSWLARALAAATLVFSLAACGPSGGPSDGGDVPDAGGDAGEVDGGHTGDGGGVDGGTDGGDPGDGGSDPGPIVPVIERVLPPRGPVGGGTVVVLGGRGFVNGFAARGGTAASLQTTVTFGGNPAVEVMVIDDDTVEVRSPPGVRGAVDIELSNPSGSNRCAGCFSYHDTVELHRVTPTEGAAPGGEVVTLTGKGFNGEEMILFGGSAATDVSVGDGGTTLTVRTPPGAPGSVDVTVVGPHSASSLRRSYVYVAPMRITSVEPAGAPLEGSVDVSIFGEGFTADAKVSFGGVSSPQVVFVSASELVARVPPRTGPGAVRVEVSAMRGDAWLEGAFAYFRTGDRDPALYVVSPSRGPVSGGICADGSGCVTLVGSGFGAAGLAVRIGTGNARVATILSEHVIEVDLPPGALGLADVQLRTSRGGVLLENAFAYVPTLRIDSITPDAGAADAPGTAVLTGVGFGAGCEVRVGAGLGEVIEVEPDGTQMGILVPPGPPGARDVRVSCGGVPGDPLYREALLPGGFRYEAPLQILQADPELGARAGNTLVTVYGWGFAPGMEILFGAAPGTDVSVLGPHLATVRAPRASSGSVDVKVRLGEDEDVLRAGYTYFDPTNVLGGGSGGGMRGTLNVTVLNGTPGMGGPVPGAIVSVDGDRLFGLTDSRGQITFSDPYLLKPVTITAARETFSTMTIARIDARNVTLFIEINEGEGEPSPPSPQPEPAFIYGKVCGFKTRPDLVLGPTERLEARVYLAPSNVYAVPPFRSKPNPIVVTRDCGTFSFTTRRYGAIALYAEFGIVDSSQTPARFTPLLMGVRRGLSSAPEAQVETTVVLDMHLDVEVPVTIEPALAPPGFGALHRVYSYLELGGEGVIPLAEQESVDDSFVLERHPRVSGDGIVFLNLQAVMDPTTGNVMMPYSLFYRRQHGDIAAGVAIGPMLEFTRLKTPARGGAFAGRLEWDFTGGQQADFQSVAVQKPAGFFMVPIWDVLLPGGERSVSLHPSAVDRLEPGGSYFWSVTTARTPRLDYNRIGYQHLGINAWTSFTQDNSVFIAP